VEEVQAAPVGVDATFENWSETARNYVGLAPRLAYLRKRGMGRESVPL